MAESKSQGECIHEEYDATSAEDKPLKETSSDEHFCMTKNDKDWEGVLDQSRLYTRREGGTEEAHSKRNNPLYEAKGPTGETARVGEDAMLEATKEKCELQAEKKANLPLQHRKVASLQKRKIRDSLDLKNRRLPWINQGGVQKYGVHGTDMVKKVSKNEGRLRELSKKSEAYAKTGKEEKTFEEQAKLIVRSAIFGAIQVVYKTDTEKYKHKVEKIQNKTNEEREWKAAHLEKEKLLMNELARAKKKVLELRRAKDEANMEQRWLTYKIDELITENVEVHTNALAEQERLKSACDSLKDELKSAERKCLRLEECNSMLEKQTSDLEMQLQSGASKIKELERKLHIASEKLCVKEQIIKEFSKEKGKSQYIRRVFSCTK